MPEKNNKPTLAIIQGGGCRQIENAIGILQALDEKSVYIDSYRGTSAGAIVSSLHASGVSGKMLESILRENPANSLFKLSVFQGIKLLIPGISVDHLYDNSKLENLLRTYMTIESTKRVMVSITRLPDYSSHMLAADPLRTLTSSSIPEVFPPQRILFEDDILAYGIDGGVIDNIPMIKIKQISDYDHIYVILCNEDTKTNKTSWTKVGRSLKALNETMIRETHQIYEEGWDELDNVTVIQPPPFRSHLLEWSENFGLINHSYNYTKALLTPVK
jgi:predicted acylesterase/phospholipase RssA